MNRGRLVLGYVVEVDGHHVTINLGEAVRSHVVGHVEGVSSFEQPGDLIAIEAGSHSLVGRVLSLAFAEPREIHGRRAGEGIARTPLRQLRCSIIGILERSDGRLVFVRQTTRLPALGAQALPLTSDELRASLSDARWFSEAMSIVVGNEARNSAIRVATSVDTLLGRHLAVLGGTGQGKTHFIADLLQQLVASGPNAQVVVFDVNGEYYPALSYLGPRVKHITIGREPARNAPPEGELLRLPYFALGRHGLFRLLLPSERAQAPALRFALESLPYVEANHLGAKPVGASENVLFDDCRQEDATAAHTALQQIRRKSGTAATWPHMRAISCLAAEFYSIQADNTRYKRNAFNYGHVASLVTRVNALLSDMRFRSVVDVSGGTPSAVPLDLGVETGAIIDAIFGPAVFAPSGPNVRIVDLSQLAQDLMPFVLGSLLEVLADQLFRRGPGRTHPTLLVLEEAHHYLRETPGLEDGTSMLAYERLAKEGRKFGLSLLLSTQRPSEVSPTVLAQCGTWAVFRLTNETDQRAVSFAAEDSAGPWSSVLSGLGRGEAIVFGAAFSLPIRIRRRELDENRRPDSMDPPFSRAWSGAEPS
jgi:uncharacterized protein